MGASEIPGPRKGGTRRSLEKTGLSGGKRWAQSPSRQQQGRGGRGGREASSSHRPSPVPPFLGHHPPWEQLPVSSRGLIRALPVVGRIFLLRSGSEMTSRPQQVSTAIWDPAVPPSPSALSPDGFPWSSRGATPPIHCHLRQLPEATCPLPPAG